MMNRLLWAPHDERQQQTALWKFCQNICAKYALPDASYASIHRWSVNQPHEFWKEMWNAADLIVQQEPSGVFDILTMPGTTWFPGATLNFAENLLKRRDSHTALKFVNEAGVLRTYSYKELYEEVGRVQQGLKSLGVKVGDRVAGFVSNLPHAVVAMLATTACGAIWSSCSPDFGFKGVLDRFSQIEPTVLFFNDQYIYNGKAYSLIDKVEEIKNSLPSLKATVCISYPEGSCDTTHDFSIPFDEFGDEDEPQFEALPFDHPLYIMYSSGTTGVPKCIVHGAGGTLLAHVKEHRFHSDLRHDDVLFYFTTCGWMMWNWLVSGLAQGATLMLFEGQPMHPDPLVLFRMVEEHGVTHFGTSPKFLSSLIKMGAEPSSCDLSSLRVMLSTGAPLLPEHMDYVYSHVKQDVQLASISGGTDIIACFMLGNPLLPVRAGEIQCMGLGMDVCAYNDSGEAVLQEKGELVCATAFPNMPIAFWNDPDGQKYHQAYFDRFPGVWTHGDYIEITNEGAVIVYGRSDATLNPGGVRIGTAEIYRIVEQFNWVKDSVVVGKPVEGDVDVCLFLVVEDQLDDERVNMIKKQIHSQASPRHVPAHIKAVPDIPRTLSGKKVEKAVLSMLMGEEVKNKEALANPEALDAFKL